MGFAIQMEKQKKMKEIDREAEDKQHVECLSAISTGAPPATGQESTG